MANLLIDVVWIPLTIHDTVVIYKEGTEISKLLCSVVRGFSSGISCITMFAHLLIGIDQHIAVVNSLHYHQRINEKVCGLLCFSMWILGTTLGILTPVSLNVEDVVTEKEEYEMIHFTQYPNTGGNCRQQLNFGIYQKVLTNVIVLISFVFPLILLIFIYGRIFSEAHQNSERTRRNSAASTTMETVRRPSSNHKYFQQYPIQYSGKHLDVSLMNLQQQHNIPPSRTSINSNNSTISQFANNMRRSMRCKMSHANAMVLYYGKIEESRAAKITLLILLMIVFCWTPYYVMIFAHVMDLTKLNSDIANLCIACAFSNTVISPLLYAYRSRRVKREIKVSKSSKY